MFALIQEYCTALQCRVP